MLGAWSSFYVMMGSSAAALTGLMFVVMSLTVGRRSPNTRDGISTFSSPTVLHFAAALLVSAVLVAPWKSLLWPGIVLALSGLFGVIHTARVIARTRRLTLYQADAEDWAWYSVLPMLAYAAVLAGAIAFGFAPGIALFAVAGGTILLVFIGIHNAWDVVTFLAIDASRPD
jgi:hypothetical protein